MKYWLLKTEPDDYSLDDLKAEGVGMWDGVRNFKAAKYMKEMNEGDKVFIYHTGKEKQIVGIGIVAKESYLDPTDEKEKFVAVDISYLSELKRPVTLKEIKADPDFKEWELVNISRLSVMPVKKEYWEKILTLS
ncbi:EVE domain-containing protein [Alkalicella caledoniensis]|uniref:EVE domain-containing protein n=1 Tax=Alkalicella caledoniensis TaxID=2731377 RepID=A0A7G9WA82_ALKCA|nr:EVE domain-containing protein [Alkalicella caledoniensis]QNO15594.1 EVE domain-containing protein [Alkalicella caledoniensis]